MESLKNTVKSRITRVGEGKVKREKRDEPSSFLPSLTQSSHSIPISSPPPSKSSSLPSSSSSVVSSHPKPAQPHEEEDEVSLVCDDDYPYDQDVSYSLRRRSQSSESLRNYVPTSSLHSPTLNLNNPSNRTRKNVNADGHARTMRGTRERERRERREKELVILIGNMRKEKRGRF